MLEMMIDSIRVSLVNYQRVVILKVKEDDQYLPIWIGPSEADSIALKLQDVDVPRPLTHDLMSSLISTLGASVSRIVVTDLDQDTFFAKIMIEHTDSTIEIDARPSDAIALAVRTDAPIFADDSVIEKAGVQMDQDTGNPIISNSNESRPLSEEEIKNLSAFSDFIETLNLDDLGRAEEPNQSKSDGESPPSQDNT